MLRERQDLNRRTRTIGGLEIHGGRGSIRPETASLIRLSRRYPQSIGRSSFASPDCFDILAAAEGYKTAPYCEYRKRSIQLCGYGTWHTTPFFCALYPFVMLATLADGMFG